MAHAPPPSDAARVAPSSVQPTLHYDLSLALHGAIASALDAEMVDRARRLLTKWLERGGPSAPLLSQWRDVLELPLDEIRAFLTNPSEHAAWLRKASPFAGMLDPRERERIIRSVRRQTGASP